MYGKYIITSLTILKYLSAGNFEIAQIYPFDLHLVRYLITILYEVALSLQMPKGNES